MVLKQSPPHIRCATNHDIDSLVAVQQSAIQIACRGFYSDADVAGWIAGIGRASFAEGIANQEVFVAEHEMEIIGFVQLKIGWAEIKELHVVPRHFRKGIGRALEKLAEEVAKQRGIPKLALFATLNAVEFYRSVGFQGEGVQLLDVGASNKLPFNYMTKML